jgi:integrase
LPLDGFAKRWASKGSDYMICVTFAATQMLAAGVPVRTVAGRLGHANAATTLNVYAHVLESSDEEAAGVLGDLLADKP